jgi:cystathionine beta-lyase/cystathionine gamma-synthase
VDILTLWWGAVVGSKELLGPMALYQNAAGAVPGPFDAYLTIRGIKTLEVRMQRHLRENARVLRLAGRAT